MRSIYFALIKDLNYVLTHSDPVIVKKGFLIKKAIEDADPMGISSDWWKKLHSTHDIIKTILNHSEPSQLGLDNSFLQTQE